MRRLHSRVFPLRHSHVYRLIDDHSPVKSHLENGNSCDISCYSLIKNPFKILDPYPIGSVYGIFTYIYHKIQLNVGKYKIHGSYGSGLFQVL